MVFCLWHRAPKSLGISQVMRASKVPFVMLMNDFEPQNVGWLSEPCSEFFSEFPNGSPEMELLLLPPSKPRIASVLTNGSRCSIRLSLAALVFLSLSFLICTRMTAVACSCVRVRLSDLHSWQERAQPCSPHSPPPYL